MKSTSPMACKAERDVILQHSQRQTIKGERDISVCFATSTRESFPVEFTQADASLCHLFE